MGRRMRASWNLQASLAVVILTVITLVGPTVDAQAAGTPGWDAGYIISDATFYNKNSMSEAQIRSFIFEKGAACVSTGDATCLKDMTFPTQRLTAARSTCQPLELSGSQRPWTIFYKTAQACGINPQVLLATLQKEQGGITNALSAASWGKAMGSSCPDTAACDPAQAGFEKQVYSAADKLMGYVQNPDSWPRVKAARDQTPIQLPYSPTCPSGPTILIRNLPTAALYTYTPYTPNQASLNAYPLGVGDKCAAYGNRNFYMNMRNYFPLTKYDTVRIAGDNRIATAIEISRTAFTTAPVVYLARQDVLADAQTAGTLKDGPILLVPSTGEAPRAVRAEIARLHPSQVIVLGGINSVSAETAASAAGGLMLSRLDGATRSATARLIADRWVFLHGPPANIYIANAGTSTGSIDAAVAGILRKGPILTIEGPQSPETTANKAWLDTNASSAKVFGIGGSASLPTEALAQMTSKPVTSLGGADRYETSALVAAHALATGTPNKTLYVASGNNLADSAAAGVLADGPMVLVAPGSGEIPPSVSSFAAGRRTALVTAIGGSNSVSDASLNAVAIKSGAVK